MGLTGFARGHLFGGKLVYNSASKVDIGISSEDSECRDSGHFADIKWNGVLTADITTSGAGGLDTGTESADSLYAVHVIDDTTRTNTPKAMLSLSGTAPIIPSGYDIFRRHAWVCNDNSSNFLKFFQIWNGRVRRLWYDEDRPNVKVLSNGSATTFTGVSLAAFVPPTSQNVFLHYAFRTGGGAPAASGADLRPTGSTSTTTLGRVQAGVTSVARIHGQMEMMCDSSQSIDYQCGNSSNDLTIEVNGYDDEV